MRKQGWIIVLLAAGLLTGCGNKETPNETQTTETETTIVQETLETQTEEEESAYIITERVEVDGKMQSYLTGEWKDAGVVKMRSMAVMMPNNKASLPQYGISRASIIYEAPVEGRVTRLMAFFEDYDDLDHIGPVRSSRDYYVYEAMAYDAIYVNWGLAVPFVKDLINSDRVDNVSQALTGISQPASEAFGRISRSGYSMEYTGYLYINGYESAVKRLGYETEYRDQFVQAFTFVNDNYRAEYKEYESAVKIYPGGTSGNRGGYGNASPYFEYNENDALYYRYQYGGKQVDEMNGEQLTVSNVVFKICHGEVREPTNRDYLAFGVHGEGDAYVFTNGKVIKGTWIHESDYDTNLFLDEDGNEIIFNRGKTWICNIWKEYAEYIYYE